MFRKNKSLVGLDVGSSVVKAIEITLEGPEPVVTGFSRIEVPQGGDVAEAVSEAFKSGKFKSKKVVTSVSGQSVVVRYVPMMRMAAPELKQAIRFETDKYLPFELDEVVLDCQALDRPPAAGIADGDATTDEQMTVLLAACKTAAIEDRVQLVQSQGLTTTAIDIDLFALANAWELCGLPEEESDDVEERAIALVDVGATRTSINVLAGGETCFSREINIGGQDMTQAVARRLGVEPFEAEALKRAGESHELEVNSAIQPVLEDLVSELSLSLDYVEHHEGVHVSEILLSGGGVLAPGATAYIEQATARSARTWNPLEGLRVDPNRVDVEELEAWAPTLVVALGLGVQGACSMIRINLLPEEYRKKSRTPIKLMIGLSTAVAVNTMLFAWLGWLTFGVAGEVESHRQVLQLEMDGLTPQVAYHKALEKEQTRYESRETTLAAITSSRIVWTRKLDEVIDIVNRGDDSARHLVWFDDLTVSQRENARMKTYGNMRASGHSGSDKFAHVANFLEDLEAAPFIADFYQPAPPEGTQTVVDDSLVPPVVWAFPLSLTLKSPEERLAAQAVLDGDVAEPEAEEESR